MLIENQEAAVRWLESIRQATQDENTVLRYARKLHEVGRP